MSAAASGRKCRSCPNMSCWCGWRAKLRSSVAWTEDRRENLMASFHSRDQYIRLEGAFDADAKFVALSAEVIANVGAYSCYPTTCAVEPLMAMAELPGPYDVRAYACVARGVLTNTCPMAPYRGVSRPVITLALERLMDRRGRGIRPRAARNPPAQSDREISLHLGHRPGLRRRRAIGRRSTWRAKRSTCRPSATARSRRDRSGAISASALPRSPSAPATARRPSPRAAWGSRRAGRRSS